MRASGRFTFGARSGYALRVSDGDNVHDVVPELLRAIRDEIKATRTELHDLRTELRDEIHELRAETREGFVRLSAGIVTNFAT